MEGFLRWRLPLVLRRALTRALAIIPAVAVLALVGEGGTMLLLVASQVVLSLQLPFAVVPLVRFTGSSALMGRHANGALVSGLAWLCALLVSAANAVLVSRMLATWHESSPLLAYSLGTVAGAAMLLLFWIGVAPLRGSANGPANLSELQRGGSLEMAPPALRE